MPLFLHWTGMEETLVTPGPLPPAMPEVNPSITRRSAKPREDEIRNAWECMFNLCSLYFPKSIELGNAGAVPGPLDKIINAVFEKSKALSADVSVDTYGSG